QPTQFGQMRQPPLAPDEETAQLILELLNGMRQRWLAHPATLRRPREVQRFAQSHKIPDLMQLHWTQSRADSASWRAALITQPTEDGLRGRAGIIGAAL